MIDQRVQAAGRSVLGEVRWRGNRYLTPRPGDWDRNRVLFDHLIEPLARVGQSHVSRRALHKGDAETIFKLAHALADGQAGNTEAVGCDAEVCRLRDGDKQRQKLEVGFRWLNFLTAVVRNGRVLLTMLPL